MLKNTHRATIHNHGGKPIDAPSSLDNPKLIGIDGQLIIIGLMALKMEPIAYFTFL